MNLIPVANYLQGLGVASIGVNLFISFMPAEVTQGILVRENFGGTKINHYLPGFHKASFMMMVRSNDATAGRVLIQSAIDALTISMDTVMDTTTVHYMRARNLPYMYAPTGSQNVEIAVNMDCCFLD